MIITRTPVRISLGGGGTDLPSYYTKFGGFVLSAAIDKYVYITFDSRFENTIRLAYSQIEVVNKTSDVKHPIMRESLKMLNIQEGIEIHSISQVPSNTGL